MLSLIKLLTSNRKRAPQLSHPLIVAGAEETTIYIYDAIVADDISAEWWGGVSAQSLVPQIRAIGGGTIRMRINSPGGDVFAAQAIAQALKDTSAHVIASVDGYAASAATVLSMAADEVEISDGGFYMIHNAWSFAMGNAKAMTSMAVLLNKVDGSIAGQYAAKSGKSAEEMKALMDEETWFTAQEAVEIGLIDRIAQPAKQEAKAQASWDLSAYSRAPKLHQVQTPAPEPQAPPENHISDDHRIRQQQRMRLANCHRIG